MFLFLMQGSKRVAHRFQYRFGAEVGASDADDDDHLRQRGQRSGTFADFVQVFFGDGVRQIDPAQKIVAGTFTVVQ